MLTDADACVITNRLHEYSTAYLRLHKRQIEQILYSDALFDKEFIRLRHAIATPAAA